MGWCLVRTKQQVRDDGVMTMGQGCRGGGVGGREAGGWGVGEGYIFWGGKLETLMTGVV